MSNSRRPILRDDRNSMACKNPEIADQYYGNPIKTFSSRKTRLRRMKRLAFRSIIAALCTMGVGNTLSAQTTWTGLGGNSFWFNNGNWDTLSTPNGVTTDVIVGAPAPTIVNGSVNINSLNVGAAGDLTLSSNFDFDFGGTAATTLVNAGSITILNNTDFQLARAVNNSGSITVNTLGNLTDLEVISDGATLSGGGTITLGGGTSRIMGLAGAILTIANQTIQGVGQVGANSIGIINQANGLIDANSSGNLLIIDPGSTDNLFNQGTLRASSGGVLQLSGAGGGSFNNTGGIIEALVGSTVRLTNATVIGGTLTTSGSGVIIVDANSNSLLENVTNSGDIQVQNNTDLGVSGTINNTGTITVNTLGNLTDIEVQTGGVTLTGGGTITLAGNTSRFNGVAGDPTLTIANQTIQGFGDVGSNSLGIVNQAGNLIHANSSGNILVIDPSGAGNMINQGTMRASNSGILQLVGLAGSFNNAGGVIEALNGSSVRLSNVSISGGTLNSSGSGFINVVANSNSFLEDLTNSGDIQVQNNTDLGVSGTINNTGTITVNTLGNLTDIEVQLGGAILTGGGTITLAGNSSRFNGVAGSPTLTIANQTIQGFGDVGSNSLAIVNQSGNLIHANSSGNTLVIDPSVAGNMINQGTMRASSGGILQLEGPGGSFNNAGGVIEALNGSSVRLSNVSISGGTLNSSGSGFINVVANSNSFLENLTNSGDIQVQNNTDLGVSGTINNTGTITVNTLGNPTDIEVQVGGVTLTGGGSITLLGSTSRIDGVAGGPTLTITDQIIQGRGNVGTNSLAIVNGANGVIHANISGTALTVDPNSAGNLMNSGTLRASGGGELLLTGSLGGTFSGDGTYEALDGGLLRSDSSAVMNSFAAGSITEGNWRAIDAGSGATIRLQNNSIVAPTSIGSNASVELSGANSAFTFGAANTSIDSTLDDVQGALTLLGGRVMSLSGGLTNSGNILVDGPTTSLNVAGDFSQTAGSLILASTATVQLNGSSNTVTGGLVGGNGTIEGDLDNLAGLLSPGLSPGSLGITGDYSQGASAAFEVEIGGLLQGISYDYLSVGGDVSLGGSLLVSLFGGFSPNAVDTFTILTGNSVNGVFANALSQVDVLGGGTFDVTYNSNSVVLSNYVVPEPSSGLLLLLAGLGTFTIRRRKS